MICYGIININYKLTYVGTLRKNKKEIPLQFLENKHRPLYGTIFGYGEHLLLLSYKQKNNKNVLMLSSAHTTGNIDKKPEVISFYNKHKGGVDVAFEYWSHKQTNNLSKKYQQSSTTEKLPQNFGN